MSGGGVSGRSVLCCVVAMVTPTTPFGVHILVSIDPREPSNIDAFAAAEFTQAAAHKFCVNLGAFKNIMTIFVTFDTSHFEMSPVNCVMVNMKLISLTFDTSHLEMSLLNESAEENILSILVTLDTSHFEISLLN